MRKPCHIPRNDAKERGGKADHSPALDTPRTTLGACPICIMVRGALQYKGRHMTGNSRAKMRKIFQDTAARYGLSEADLYVRDRHKEFVLARHEAWAKCYRNGHGNTQEAIAALAGWDYTTVAHGIAQYRARANG